VSAAIQLVIPLLAGGNRLVLITHGCSDLIVSRSPESILSRGLGGLRTNYLERDLLVRNMRKPSTPRIATLIVVNTTAKI